MKNKILSLVLALCLIVPCALMFTACGKDDDTIYAGTKLTLQEAVDKAEGGDLVKLDSNITLTAQVNINKKVTIDLAGYTINNAEDIWDTTNKEWSLISVKENGDLTIKNGTIQAKENDCYAIDIRDGGKCVIESGKYIGNVHSVYVREGNLSITGGEFDIQQLSDVTGDSRYTLNCYDASYNNGSATITVTGGKFANYNPNGSTSEYPTADFLADGYTVDTYEDNGDTWYVVVSE